MVTLLASAARTTSSTSAVTSVPDLGLFRSGVFMLNVTAAAADVGDTLDVYLQSSPDGGTTWNDFVHFTQVLGNGGAVKHLATWHRDITPEREMGTPQDAAMAAGVLQGPVGSTWRVKWVIVDSGDADQSFTFSLTGDLRR